MIESPFATKKRNTKKKKNTTTTTDPGFSSMLTNENKWMYGYCSEPDTSINTNAGNSSKDNKVVTTTTTTTTTTVNDSGNSRYL
jgi:hypothetical protein